ncbi:MAG TPA: hypothetical protein VF649_00150 [Sphingomonas sp.]|jgi:hypothetical protein|uniref:hypothetical protein n=1 Tax=Sphingomonas sp. TaxID=28214 RepID=UPI002ED7F8EC
MFHKANEFESVAAASLPSGAPSSAGKAHWPAPLRILLGLLFLVAWLPITLLCWAGLTAIIAMKIGVDAADHAGDTILGRRRIR